MTAVTTRPVPGPDTPSDLWVTTLFAQRSTEATPRASADDTVSARGAFQAVLHGRAVLVDARTRGALLRQGSVHPDLSPVSLGTGVSAQDADSWRGGASSTAALVATGATIVLLADDDQAANQVATALRGTTGRRVVVITGGFLAWQANGLPRVDPDIVTAA